MFSSASNRLAQFSHAVVTRQEKAEDPRLKEEFGDLVIEDQYAILREKYGMLRESKPMAEPRISQLLTPKHLTYSS
jgi:hypothetical protein